MYFRWALRNLWVLNVSIELTSASRQGIILTGMENVSHKTFVFTAPEISDNSQDPNGNGYDNKAADYGDEKLQDDSV